MIDAVEWLEQRREQERISKLPAEEQALEWELKKVTRAYRKAYAKMQLIEQTLKRLRGQDAIAQGTLERVHFVPGVHDPAADPDRRR